MKCLYTPDEILSISIENGQKKIQKPLVAKLILGFIGGAMISLGYLAYVRVSASIPADLASVQALVGDVCGFPNWSNCYFNGWW